ncbi:MULTISPECIES: carbohydrate ABC transporter permease [Atopobiaceae]|uniref:Sugar ABC transporter permease n=1 Tax=Thermophilibacter provencensis TaxID=1852386 RepID=A0A921GF43_9ACTN|nr:MULTISPECIES: sugar ABC transporter permease [Atopobiaceae]MBM6814622.1 sugar ABC transporter permease [Olsenella uli]NJE81760.1 sugar ABC transporter permease [Olsenella sp. SW781]HJF44699.1 sugar ABC transporter permease [Thermophilibacter provencensis]
MASAAVSKAGSDRNRTFLAILIPVLILFIAFNTIPLLTGFFYSFTDSKGYGAFEIVGLQNYIDLFQDARVGNSYLFTFKISVVSTILVNVISLMLAIGLSSKIKFKSALRGIYFVPRILGGLVVGYVFSYFFTYIVPALTGTTSMLASKEWAWVAIVVVLVWQACAQTTIIYITGLSSVPEDVYEAGALDGATGWDKFRYLTFPLIMPSITTNMVLVMKDMLMTFDQIVAMTSGGPAQSTESISYLIYQNGLNNSQFGFQCANAVIFFIVIAVISIAQTKFLNSKEEQL